jgi:hypothetical protein
MHPPRITIGLRLDKIVTGIDCAVMFVAWNLLRRPSWQVQGKRFRKRVAAILRVASQNMNVAFHVRRCSRNPAMLHEETAKHPLPCSYPIQPVSRRPPTPSKTQRFPQTPHIAGEGYRVSLCFHALAINTLPLIAAFRKSNAQPN